MTLADYSKKYNDETHFDNIQSIETTKQILGLIFVIRGVLNGEIAKSPLLKKSYYRTLSLFIENIEWKTKIKKWWSLSEKEVVKQGLDYFSNIVKIDLEKTNSEISTELIFTATETEDFSIEHKFRFFEVLLNYDSHGVNFETTLIKKMVSALTPFIEYCELKLNFIEESLDGKIISMKLEPHHFEELNDSKKNIYIENNGTQIAFRTLYHTDYKLFLINNFHVEAEYQRNKLTNSYLFDKKNINLYQENLLR